MHRARHVVVDHRIDGKGRGARLHPERLGDTLANRLYGPRCVDWHPTTEQTVGIKITEHDIRVGNGRLVTAARVTGRSGIGLGAAWPDT